MWLRKGDKRGWDRRGQNFDPADNCAAGSARGGPPHSWTTGSARKRAEGVGFRGRTQRTDSAGAFAFPNADKGDYLVIVSKRGFQQRRLSLRIDDGKGRELAIHMYPGTEKGPASMESWAFDALRDRLLRWSPRSRITRADFAKYGEVGTICDIAWVRNEESRRPNIVLNGVVTLFSWSLCDFHADEVELIEFGSQAPVGKRRGKPVSTGSIIYIWERR